MKKKGETSYKETAFGIIPRSKLILLEIEGIKRSWDFVVDANARGRVPFTAAFLKDVHRVGFAWIFPEFEGFRKIEVSVSKHTPPKYFLVSQLVDDFMKDLKVRLKYLPTIDADNYLFQITELLAWAHHRFLWIHPFVDYNGRIARLLINIILLKLNLPPIEMKVESSSGRITYLKALRAADSGDHSLLEKMILSALKEAIIEF